MLHPACYNCCPNSRKKPFEALTCKEIASLNSRAMVLHPAEATKMFQKVPESLIEKKLKTSEEADRVFGTVQKVCF